MKILHTSDWHIGKRLGRHDRMDEYADVLGEVETIADEHAVDLVLVSGDV
jgi:DNA repair protein SbcD/Mre11